MAFVSVKDFTTGLAAKLSTWLVNTDENVTKHGLVDSANAEVLGKAGDAAATQTDGTAVGLTSVFKQISKSIQAAAASLAAALAVTNATSSQADGHSVTLGAKADAASTATDTTPISSVSIWKQISKSAQALVAGLVTIGQNVMANSTPVAIASDQSAIPVIQKPSSVTGGQTPSRVNSAGSTNATSLKGSAGNLLEVDLKNNAAYAVYVKFYNKASAPTVGTDTPVWTLPLAAGEGYARSFPRGKPFATGLAYAITKNQADSDTTVVVAGDVTGSMDWI